MTWDTGSIGATMIKGFKALLILLIFSLPVFARTPAPPVDLNGDNRMDVLDLLTLLTAMQPGATVAAETDLDQSGATDMDDVLILLCLMRDENTPEDEPDKFEYALIINHRWIHNYSQVIHMDWTTEQQDVRYRVYSNRELSSIALEINNQVLIDSSGYLPRFYDTDTLVIDHNTSYLTIDSIPWSITLEDIQGNRLTDSGFIRFDIVFDAVDGGDYFYVSEEIKFPLVLQGIDQRLGMLECGTDSLAFYFDLNPQDKPFQVIKNIEELAAQIDDNYINQYSINEKYAYISPATNRFSGNTENRLRFFFPPFYCPQKPSRLDDNEELLKKIGFPDWKLQIYLYSDGSYK